MHSTMTDSRYTRARSRIARKIRSRRIDRISRHRWHFVARYIKIPNLSTSFKSSGSKTYDNAVSLPPVHPRFTPGPCHALVSTRCIRFSREIINNTRVHFARHGFFNNKISFTGYFTELRRPRRTRVRTQQQSPAHGETLSAPQVASRWIEKFFNRKNWGALEIDDLKTNSQSIVSLSIGVGV